jgi:Concanavalin A-like lectin/glucanases superfamily/PKD domain
MQPLKAAWQVNYVHYFKSTGMKKNLLFTIIAFFFIGGMYAQTINNAGILSNPQSPKFAKLIAGGSPNYYEVQKAFLEYEKANPEKPHQKINKKNNREENEEEENNDPWRFFYQRWQSKVAGFVKSDGSIMSVMDPSIQNYIKEGQAALKQQGANKLSTSPDWRLVGPNLVIDNGAVNDHICNVYCVDFNKTTTATGYAGTETGYIFKTTNYGDNWNLVGTAMVFGSGIRSIATDPGNADIVYACGSNHIFKTTDGGLTWNIILTIPNGPTGSQAWNIRVNPVRTQTILVGSESGLYQSYDGGANFTLRLAGKVKGLQYKVGDTTQLFAFSMQPVATANYPTGNYNSNIFKSYDGGKTFANKTAGVYTYNPAWKYNYLATELTVTAANANVLYAIMGGDAVDASNVRTVSGEIYTLKSTDAGETWSFAKAPLAVPNMLVFPWQEANFANGYWQGDYNTWIIANPLNADEVIVGGLTGYKSTNQGAAWSKVLGYSSLYGTHPDQQGFYMSGTDLWINCDGGLLKSTNFLSSQPQVKTNGLYASEIWGFGVGWNEDIITGGKYHNGNGAYYNGAYPDKTFIHLGGAESPTGYVSPYNTNVYHSDINAYKLPATITGPLTGIAKPSKFPNESYGYEWSNIIYHPNKSKTMFLGNGVDFWRSDDDGGSFSSLNIFSGNVLDFDIALSDSNYVYVCTQDNKIWVSTNGGTSFANITGIVPNGIKSISVNPVNPQECWVLIRGSGNVYKTTNAGTLWTSVGGGNLAGKNGGDILVQADATNATCYVMCNNGGIYYQNNSTAGNWVASNNNLPAAHAVRRIAPFYAKNKLYFASSGGGVWEHDFISNTLPFANFSSDIQTVECATDVVNFYSYSIADESAGAAAYTWSFPGAASVDVTNPKNPKVTYSTLGNYDVSLTVKDGNNQTSATRTLTGFIKFPTVNCCQNSALGWNTEDIGGPAIAGSTCYKPATKTHTIKASGSDIWLAADEFRFEDTVWTGDGQIIARVKSQDNTNPWAKAGVMIRENITAGSKNAFVFTSPGNSVNFSTRSSTNGGSGNLSGIAGITAPYWVKLTRRGAVFTGYSSADGVNWTLIGTQNITMNATVRVGLAVTSHDNTQLGTAVFENVSVGSFVNTVCNGGSANGCPARDTVPGKAINFYDNAYMSVPVNVTAVNTFTITGWIKPRGILPAESAILSWDNGYFYMGQQNDNQLEYIWNSTGHLATWNSGLFVPADKWSFVAMVVHPDSTTLYLNNKMATNVTPQGIAAVENCILGNSGVGAGFFTGEMDELTVWKRSLSTNEIDSMRHLTKEKIADNTAATHDAALVSYFQFNDDLEAASYNQIDSSQFSLSGPVNKTVSTAPVGAGNSSKNTITGPGNYSFANTGVTLGFPASGTYPGGNVWVSKINQLPDQYPHASIQNSAYWVINNYGTDSAFSPSVSLQLNNAINVSAANAAAPRTFKLFKRLANADGNSWGNATDSAGSAVAGTPGNLTFVPANISSDGQLFVNGGLQAPLADTVAGKVLDLTSAGNPVIPLSPLAINSNTFTVTAWVKPNGLQKVFSQIFSSNTPNTFFGIGFAFPGYVDNLNLVYSHSSVNYYQQTNINLTANQWNHIALTYSPDEVRIYLNGGTPWIFPKASSNTPGGFPPVDFTKAPVTVNADIHNQAGNYKGQLDEMGFYSTVLTQQQIREKMHLTKKPVTETGMVSYYQFNQYNSTTNTLYDAVGNGNPSTVNNINITDATTPVASGSSFSIANVNASGTYNFTGTGASLTFPGPVFPNGEMVVSRLNSRPDSVPGGLKNTSSKYWIINNWGTNTTFTAPTAMQFDNLNISAADAAAPNVLKLLKRSTNEHLNNWATMCGAATATAGSNGTVTFDNSCNNNSFSQFLIGTTGSSPLPVTLISFTGQRQQDVVLLQWNVAQEINLSHYQIERSSDGLNYDAIGTVKATNRTAYTFADNQPLNGVNYYRLKMMDADSKFSYSNVVKVSFDNNSFIKVLPNPVTTNQPLSIQNTGNVTATVNLYLADGKLYKKYTIAPNSKIEISNLPKGVLIYRATNTKGKTAAGREVVL